MLAATDSGDHIIGTILLDRVDIHSGLEVELPRELIGQSSIAATSDVRVVAPHGCHSTAIRASSSSESLCTRIESHEVLAEHGTARLRSNRSSCWLSSNVLGLLNECLDVQVAIAGRLC